MNIKKLAGLIAIIFIVTVSFLAAFRVVTWSYFWYSAAIVAIFAWFVLPKMR